MKVYRCVYDANHVYEQGAVQEEFNVVKQMTTTAQQIPCFIDIMLRRLLFRSWVCKKTHQLEVELADDPEWKIYQLRQKKPIDSLPNYLASVQADEVTLNGTSIIGYEGMEVGSDGVKQDASIKDDAKESIMGMQQEA